MLTKAKCLRKHEDPGTLSPAPIGEEKVAAHGQSVGFVGRYLGTHLTSPENKLVHYGSPRGPLDSKTRAARADSWSPRHAHVTIPTGTGSGRSHLSRPLPLGGLAEPKT